MPLALVLACVVGLLILAGAVAVIILVVAGENRRSGER